MSGIRKNWSEEETLIALSLYYQIPFGRISSKNPLIEKSASILNRSANAMAMKMCNLARFDKNLRKRNVEGLSHGSKMDQYVWETYSQNYEKLNEVYERLKKKLLYDKNDDYSFPEGHNIIQESSIRYGQNFFRNAVLSAYENRCCITGISIPAFLIASHIKPWKDSENKTEKANPHNGLCLNALHDRAFDQGYITISTDYQIIVSDVLKRKNNLDDTTRDWICSFDKKQITLPHRTLPDSKFLQYHNDVIFKR